MKLCFLTSPNSIHDQRLLGSLAERGHEIHVITLHPPKAIAGVYLHFLAAPIMRYKDVSFLFNYGQIKHLLEKINPDVVGGLGLSNYGFYAAVCGRRPLVVAAYGSDVLRAPEESLRLKWMVQYAIRRADLITVDAEILKKKVIELGGTEEKIVVFPLGVDEALLSLITKRDFKQKDQFTLLSYRSLEPLYNIELILHSLPLVLKHTDKIKLVVGGDGTQRNKLEKLASQIGIINRIQFIGAIPHERIPSQLESADVYLSTSLSDSTSVSLLEAMAAGVFPIVSDIPGNREWIENGVNGFIVPLDDPQILADKIVEILNKPNLRKSVAKKNEEIIKQRALWRNTLNTLEYTYEQLLKKGNRS